MRWVAAVRARIALVLGAEAAEARLSEEFRFHVEMQTEQNIRAGLEPREARRQALIAFGGMERHKESMRDGRGLAWLRDLRRDVWFGARGLIRNPGFTVVAAVTIALGVGATTAVFSLLNALLLRPLEVPSPDELVVLTESRSGAFAQGLEGIRLPYTRFAAYREATDEAFAGLAAHQGSSFSLREGGTATAIRGTLASGNYFDVLRITPALGRFFTADDEAGVVLAHHLWRARFGGDPGILGRSVYLDGRPFTVVGVAPAGFVGTTAGLPSDLWVPVAAARQREELASMSSWVAIFGRLRPGTSREEAAALVDLAAKRIPPDEPQTRVRGAELEPMHGLLHAGLRDAAGSAMTMLLGTALLVLLIAVTNIAGMLLARGVARRREIAIRLAMGAERGRIVRQLLTESVLLALVGGAGGVALAAFGRGLAAAVSIPFARSVSLDLPLDVRVLGFALFVSLGTALLFGLLPALRASQPVLLPSLKEGSSAASVTSTRGRSFFVGSQFCVAVVLLMVAALFIRSLQQTAEVDLGFDPEGILVATIDLAPHDYDGDRARAFYATLAERVRAIPGVESVSLAQATLAGSGPGANDMEAVGTEGEPRRERGVPQNRVDSTFFSTTRMELVAGRGFSSSDGAGSPAVTIINETLAQRLWPGQNPVGQRVSTHGGELEIVGVVADGRYAFRNGQPSGYAFLPLSQRSAAGLTLHVRNGSDTGLLVRTIRDEVRRLDPDVAVIDAAPLSTSVDRLLAPQRAITTLLTLFGLIAVVLAGIGAYGVMAFEVGQRSREIGIRIALGAPSGAVVRRVIGRGAALAATGAVAGLLLANGASLLLQGFLYGVEAVEPVILLVVATVLVGAGLLASALPVLRMIRLDPAKVLRSE